MDCNGIGIGDSDSWQTRAVNSKEPAHPLDVSIVIPVYDEVENLPELVASIDAAMAAQTWTFELLAVDDGSRDGSAVCLRQLARTRAWLRPVFLARNYGQSTALQAGFDRVRGRYVVTLDADLQNDPGDIPLLLHKLEEDAEIDMVSGWRKHRQDAAISRKLPSRLANRLISRVTGVRLRDYGCGLKAYRRHIIERIHLYGELHRFIPSLAVDVGARIAELPVRHHARTRGKSKYGIDRTFRVILDLLLMVFLMRYRQRPLHAFGGLGLCLAVPGGLALLWLLVQKFTGQDVGTRPLLLVAIMLLLMAVQLVVTGLIGELLIRVYHEGSGAPQFYASEADGPADSASDAGQDCRA